jgi:hypothetical protein
MTAQSDGATYAPFTVDPDGGAPPAEALAFLADVRTVLERLRPARAKNTWAMYSTGFGLVIVLPLDPASGTSSARLTLHLSLQLHVVTEGAPAIEGAWTDSHLAWDWVPRPDFSAEGLDADARAKALEWLGAEVRRPIVRRDWTVLGVTVYSRWHVDGAGWDEGRGFWPIALVLWNRPTRTASAGFLDE